MNRIKKGDKSRGRERGQALLEGALVLPLFSLLLFGIFDVGRVLMVKQAITNAAREGARVGAVSLDDEAALSSATLVSQDYLSRTALNPSLTTIHPDLSQVNGIMAIQVTIDYDFASQLFRWVPGIPDTIKLNTQVAMRREA